MNKIEELFSLRCKAVPVAGGSRGHRCRTALLWALTALPCMASTVFVNSEKDLLAALQDVPAGTTIQLATGEWSDLNIRIRAQGTEDAPVTVEAQDPGGVIITGRSAFVLDGDYIVVRGFHFRETLLPKGAEALISLRNDKKEESNNCRMTDLFFENCNPQDLSGNYPWIRMYGHNNRVDHCRFSGQKHKGRAIQVRVYEPDPHHRIDHNLFFDRKPGLESNGYEVIQIGLSGDSMKVGNVLVENNVFWRCDGEIEIISSKSNGNIIRNNKFLECVGTITLRHGNNCVVADNIFHGNDRFRSGGVRVIGTGHRVEGNLFYELDGRTGAVVVLYCGIPDSPLNGYFAAHDTVLKNNIFVNNHGNAILLTGGYGQRNRTILPTGVRLEGNVISRSSSGGGVAIAGYLEDLSLSGNLYESGQEAGIAALSGLTFGDLEFRNDQGLPVPYSVIDGVTGRKPLLQAPETPRICDVGPEWLH